MFTKPNEPHWILSWFRDGFELRESFLGQVAREKSFSDRKSEMAARPFYFSIWSREKEERKEMETVQHLLTRHPVWIYDLIASPLHISRCPQQTPCLRLHPHE